MSTMGQRIKLRRKTLGISAEKLGEKLNVSRTTINRYEKGYIDKIPAVSLIKIASELKTTTSYLMGRDMSLDEAAIIQKLSQLDEANKLAVINIIDNLLATQIKRNAE